MYACPIVFHAVEKGKMQGVSMFHSKRSMGTVQFCVTVSVIV